jgi:excisionase family DNA binding protein
MPSLHVERLISLANMIRQNNWDDSKASNHMPRSINHVNVEKLLMAADIVRRCEIERLVSVTEAAEIRGVTRQTIWKMLKSGTLTRYVVGGHTVIDRDELLGLPPKGELRMNSVGFQGMRKTRKS